MTVQADMNQQPTHPLPSPVSISYGPFQPISPDEPRIPIEYIGPPPELSQDFELVAPEPKKLQSQLTQLALNGVKA